MDSNIIEQIRSEYLSRVKIIIPFEPKTVYYVKPSKEIVEFVCYLASTLSLWFGFSILSVSSPDYAYVNFCG